jgi:predicted metal-binding membrane protein
MSQNNTKKHSMKRRGRNNTWLPVVVALAGLALVALAAWGLSAKEADNANIEVSGAPALKVDKEKVDLGDVKVGQVVEASFRLSNAGDQTLRFSEAPYIEVVEGC